MPVMNNYHIVEYAGNNSGRSFNFPFRCFSLEHLVVELITIDDSTGEDVEVIKELVRNTEYSVSGGLSNDGGSITYPLLPETPALKPVEKVRIYRETPLSQDIDYPTYQQAIENALDKSVMSNQEVAEGAKGAQDAIAEFGVRMTQSESSVAGAVGTANSAVATADEALTTARLASGNASIAVSSADEAQSRAEAAISASNIAEENSDYAVSKANEAKELIDAAVGIANTAGSNAATALTTANTAQSTADSALMKADTAIIDSASALETANSMQADVDAARVASEDAAAVAQTAVAAAEDSTHGHANKAVLDDINFDSTTGSFSVGGVEMARADLSNADVCGFADTVGSNIDSAAYKALLGLPEDTAAEVAAINTGMLGMADTAGSNISVAAYSSQLGLDGLASIDAGNVDVDSYKAALGPRVVTTLAGVTGQYPGEQILRVSGVADDPEDDMYFWNGTGWFKEGV